LLGNTQDKMGMILSDIVEIVGYTSSDALG